MDSRNNSNIEHMVDLSPKWLKSLYFFQVLTVKKVAQFTGVLSYLDKHAHQSARCHYLRSLLAVYQLNDMIHLDIPWWTYSAIAWMDDYLAHHKRSLRVFEYGSGASTIWLAKRVKSVVSIEHDNHWFKSLNSHVKQFNHVTLKLEPPHRQVKTDPSCFLSPKAKGYSFKSYVKSIKQSATTFDVIIIDGRCRVACLNEAVEHLSQGGIILFDNSNRTRYQKALSRNDLSVMRFKGRLPGSPFKSETAIIQKKTA